MNILLVSQCSKKALKETRRVIDQFAERTGDRTWQTAITEQGLATLRKLLKQSARRNTSVACHWIRGSNRTDLKWIVGNPRRFNSEGTVPTNVTGRDILRAGDENPWHTAEDIRILAGIAALFHDVGKANTAFQNKINPKKSSKKNYEPYRHEWVSLRLFEAFVCHSLSGHSLSAQSLDQPKPRDAIWLEALSHLTPDQDDQVLAALIQDAPKDNSASPLSTLPPLAKAVGWLILTHHKLIQAPERHADHVRYPEDMLDKGYLQANWNSPQVDHGWQDAEIKETWSFKKGTPFCSKVWCERVARLARQALKRPQLMQSDWLNTPFSLHLARLSLMLADHYYSSVESCQSKHPWHDGKYRVFANTVRNKASVNHGQYNQTLDEHLIGVYHHAHQVVRLLPSLHSALPVITRLSVLKKRTLKTAFSWQNKAYELAVSVRDRAQQQGFFGVNIASTGRGKTFANARIMYGLSDERLGCRFNVALGLRTLTLQTGDAFKAFLNLDDEDMAVMIGSSAVKSLHEQAKSQTDITSESNQEKTLGSESANALDDEDHYIRYEGALGDTPLSKWLAKSPRANQLVSAPVLISTIDHLMPATEGSRGGKQIAPMLRLLTSDLVLDEPDDFGQEDLPALCRLVHWAGLLGSKVLLSSATLPPDLVKALFDAYLAGRKAYEASVSVNPSQTTNVVCAWFDEFRSDTSQCATAGDFLQSHQDYIKQRAAKLGYELIKRRVELVYPEQQVGTATEQVAACVFQSLLALHQQHHHAHPRLPAKASFGLVRMANINPLVAVAKALMAMPSPSGVRIHYCVYHSQFLLLQRSHIEQMLDTVLNRKQPDAIWHQASVASAIAKHPNDQHIFVVLGSPVTEVGRDHSYDWAVVEPSSMRSLIQLAGRVLRHQPLSQSIETANIHLLNQNVRALRGDKLAYIKPGFESDALYLKQKSMDKVTAPSDYQTINALPRIQKGEALAPTERLIDLEHMALQSLLWGNQNERSQPHASLWWQTPCHWTNHLQQRFPFRRHTPQETYSYYMEEEFDAPKMRYWTRDGEPVIDDKQSFDRSTDKLDLAHGVNIWGGRFDYPNELIQLAERLDIDIRQASIQFGIITLRIESNGRQNVWYQSDVLGMYKAEQ